MFFKKKMTIPKQIILIGGGASISEGLSLGLKDKIRDKFVITLNFSFKHFDSIFTMFVDHDFYNGNIVKDSKDNFTIQDKEFFDLLRKQRLLVGTNTLSVIEGMKRTKSDNTIFLKSRDTYDRDIKDGLYKETLVGVAALTLSQYLMNFSGEIFILGYDWTVQVKEKLDPKNYVTHHYDVNTHYYSDEETNHRGQHFTGYYQVHDPNNFFKHYNEPNIKIYNVSLNSNISNFEKISYERMFELLDKETYNKEVRNEIRDLLTKYEIK